MGLSEFRLVTRLGHRLDAARTARRSPDANATLVVGSGRCAYAARRPTPNERSLMMGAMKLGVNLPMAGSGASPEAITRVAQEAEEAGLDSVWGWERLMRPTVPIA